MDYPRICPARWLSDQPFGMCPPPHDFLYPFYDVHSNYFQTLTRYNHSISKEFGSTIENEKGNYKITLDVKHFRPDDISVKVTENEIIVEGKHEERQDTHGFISRQFKRRYALPSHCPTENVTSTMSSDGCLTIIAEKRSNNTEKIVPIKMCGTCPRNTQIESKISSELTQKTVKENIKDTEDIACNKTETLVKEEHSRLLRPELIKEAITETNGEKIQKMSTKQAIDVMGMSEKKDTMNIGTTSKKIENSLTKSSLGVAEKKHTMNIGATSNKIENSLAKSSPGMSEKKDTMDIGATSNKIDNSLTKSSLEVAKKKAAMNIGATSNKIENSLAKSSFGVAEKKDTMNIGATSNKIENFPAKSGLGLAEKMDTMNMGATSNKFEESLAKTTLGLSELTEQLGQSFASTSDMCGIKGMSKTLIEESSSSFKSLSSSSTMKASGKISERVSDIICAELKEAAENV